MIFERVCVTLAPSDTSGVSSSDQHSPAAYIRALGLYRQRATMTWSER
jgi:hypothetical protein